MKSLSALVALVWMSASLAEAQPLLSPRAMALGGYDAAVRDVRGFAADPAGLVYMKDWDFHTATFYPTGTGGSGFVFNGFSIGKRLFGDNAVAFQYAPGTLQEFLIPSAEKINGQNISTDKQISYEEPIAIGLAHEFSGSLAAGIGVRVQTASVTDPQYQLQLKDSTIVGIPNTSEMTLWFIDPAVLWKPQPSWTLCAIVRGVLAGRNRSFPQEYSAFALPTSAAFEAGLAFDASSRLRVTADASTARHGGLGVEWGPGSSLNLRAGAHLDGTTSRLVDALGIGAGWSYEFVDFDLAYLRFTDRTNRTGTAPLSALDASSIRDLSMNPFTSSRLAFSVKAFFGPMREPQVRIDAVDVSGGVFPAAYQSFAYRPIGNVRVRNISSKSINVRASLFIDRFMDQPTETPAVSLAPGDAAVLPLTAVFNDRIRSVEKLTVRDAEIRVSAVSAEEFDDHVQSHVVIHGRNDWDGDVISLRYYVTPDDPEIIRYSRDILLSMRDSLGTVPRELEPFRKAQLLFNAFAGKLMYVNDPKLTADYVQYPSETLSLRGGDCDDMTVCFASLLSSIGISTAFVDVIPPGHPEDSHIYLLFDTGIDPRYGKSVSDNPKRYVVRKTGSGKETLWIPIETTVIMKGFQTAWIQGAEEHFQHTDVDLGLAKGWVKIVDVN